jgi:tetratricopeptide (TPR) repeat protein
VPDDLVVNVDANLALWDGKPTEYWRLQSGRRDRAVAENRKEDAAAIEADALTNLAAIQGQNWMDDLARAAAKPNAIPMLVMQSAVVHVVHGDASELRDMARLEKIGATGGLAAVLWPYARAFKLSADGKHDDAIALLQALQSPDSRKANVHAYIGHIEERAGRRDDAIASYRRVIAAQPALGLDFAVTLSKMALVRLLKETGDAAGSKIQADALRAQWAGADKTFVLTSELDRLTK